MPPDSKYRVHLDHPAIVGVLLVACFGQAFFASRLKSAVYDEPTHIGAGLSYFRTGEILVNRQHPPLLKEIGALPLVLLGMRLPTTADTLQLLGGYSRLEWPVGVNTMLLNGPESVLFWSRLPFILLATLLGWLIYIWGRELLGGTAAVGALFLYALDPTILAHAFLVTTDLGCAAFTLMFLFALWRYLKRRNVKRLLACGLALGAALASKFSAVCLLPITAVLVLAGMRWISAAGPKRESTLADPYGSDNFPRRVLWCLAALAAMGVVAAALIEVLYFFPSNPFLPYFRGMRLVNADHNGSYMAFMAGHFQHRFLSYYAVAYLLKEPIPSLILAGIGLAALFLRRSVTVLDWVFLLLPPAVLFAGYTAFSDDIGIRYIIPALPFLYLIGGGGLAFLIEGTGPRRRIFAAALCGWLMVTAIGIYPDHLSYFNEAACLLTDPSRIGLDGGSRCGPYWLDDSNVDWGQGLKQLNAWLDSHPRGEPVHLAYFGVLPPEVYGMFCQRIGESDVLSPPATGLYVLSAHVLARSLGRLALERPGGGRDWLLDARPAAIVGHAFYVFDVGSRVASKQALPDSR